MYGVVYFFTRLLVLFFSFISVALLVRAILSWFVREGDSPFSSLLILITEPLILPVRRLCDRFGWFQGVPMDVPFLLTALFVSLLTTLLRALV